MNFLRIFLVGLMGYKGGASSLGFYDSLKDSIEAIRPDVEKNFNENINLVLLKKIGSIPTLIDFPKNELNKFLTDKFN